MTRTILWMCRTTFVYAIVVVVEFHTPTRAWAKLPAVIAGTGASGESPEDNPDEASRLVVMGDFNRDGIVDMAKVTSPAEDYSGPTFLTVSLGRADGTFKKIASNPILGHAPRSIVVGDFNRDGILDLIVGDDDGALMLLLGDGTGKLIPAGNIARLDSIVSIAVADLNHDGILDLAVSDWRASSVTVLLGAGNGSFRRESSFPLRMRGTVPHVAAADFNGDGILDLAVVYDDENGDTYDVMLGIGNGSFTYAPELSVSKDPNSHCTT